VTIQLQLIIIIIIITIIVTSHQNGEGTGTRRERNDVASFTDSTTNGSAYRQNDSIITYTALKLLNFISDKMLEINLIWLTLRLPD